MSEEAKAMGIRFQELRQEKGLSQSELARAAGVPLASLKNWEQGRRMPAFDAAFKLAKDVTQAKDLQELLNLQTRYVQSQMKWYADQTQEFGQLMAKAFKTDTKPSTSDQNTP